MSLVVVRCGYSDLSGHGLFSPKWTLNTQWSQVWAQCGPRLRVTNLHVHRLDTKHTIDTMDYSGVLLRNILIVIWDHLQLLCIWRKLASSVTTELIPWILETFFKLCFECMCMCVLTVWMLRRFNLLCQVKFTSFRLRLAFLEDFIKIGISSEQWLSLSVLHIAQGVTCYMCRVNIMGWWQVRTFSGVTLYCGRDKIYWSVFPRVPAPGDWWPCLMWPRVMSPSSSSESQSHQPSPAPFVGCQTICKVNTKSLRPLLLMI